MAYGRAIQRCLQILLTGMRSGLNGNREWIGVVGVERSGKTTSRSPIDKGQIEPGKNFVIIVFLFYRTDSVIGLAL